MLTVQSLAIPDVKLLIPRMIRDDRGYLAEIAHNKRLADHGFPAFVQENQSLSTAIYTVRGMHAQKPPHAQAKLVRVLKGKIFDVAVDIRPGSPTYLKHVSAMLDAAGDIIQMYIPTGFLHGFCTLEPDTIVMYKMSNYYAPGSEVGAAWNDPDLGIEWPVPRGKEVLSDKDKQLGRVKELPPIVW